MIYIRFGEHIKAMKRTLEIKALIDLTLYIFHCLNIM